jgi:ribosomal-protein-alanine N-acetyltransferase
MTHTDLAHLTQDIAAPMENTDPPQAWTQSVPVLHGPRVTVREVTTADAKALYGVLSASEVSRFISVPPGTAEGFTRYVGWARAQRSVGRYLALAVVPRGADTPIGLFHLRGLERGFRTADWGFALESEFWGSGIFREAAELVLDFAFDVVGTERLEGRVARCNARGNGALCKLGAEREGVLRRSFHRDGEYLDQVVWSILRTEWLARRRLDTFWACRGVH